MYFALGRPRSIFDLTQQLRTLDSEKIPQVPIALIDDEPFYYLDILRNHNFNIRVFEDIDDINLVRSYAIVMCDIHGVGGAFGSDYEGAHVIAQIRSRFPEKVVIAYTGQQHDATYNKYLSKSDYVLKKDSDADSWIATLEDAIRKTVDPIFQWERVRLHLLVEGLAIYDVMRIEDQFVRDYLNGENTLADSNSVKQLPDNLRTVVQSFTGSILFELILGT